MINTFYLTTEIGKRQPWVNSVGCIIMAYLSQSMTLKHIACDADK